MNAAKTIAAALVVLALAGCATTGDVMQRDPAASFVSSKPANAATGCLAPAMLSRWPETKVVPSGSGQMIVVSGSAWGNPVATITIETDQPGSRIVLRRGSVSDRVFSNIETSARGCA